MVHLNSNNLTIVSNDRIIPTLLDVLGKKESYLHLIFQQIILVFFFNLKKIKSNRTKSKNGSYLTMQAQDSRCRLLSVTLAVSTLAC